MTGLTNIAFDFDGTLVDSAPGILTGIKASLEKNKITPVIPLTPEIIGPPLRTTLALLCGISEESLLNTLTTDFKANYDSTGYRDTVPYPGIATCLAHLQHIGCNLYLATNKRGTPTRLILNHLGWASFFQAVYCLDEHTDCSDKKQMLGKLISQESLEPIRTPYVGDTQGDADAAAFHHMPYIHAAWGYGQCSSVKTQICSTTQHLLEALETFTWS